jgi:hypothetical protein
MDPTSTADVISTLRALLERIEHEPDLYDDTMRDALKRMVRNRIDAIETALSLAAHATDTPQE